MNRPLPILTLFVAALFTGGHVSATPVLYEYVGNPFDSIDANVPSSVTNLSISLLLDDALAANLNGSNVSPLSWEYSDGLNTYTQDNWSDSTVFQFVTDGSGNVTGWAHQLQRDPATTPVNEPNFMLSVFQAPDIFVNRDVATYCSSASGCSNYFAIIENNPGSWTATVVPIPAAPWLFISALGVAGWFRRVS